VVRLPVLPNVHLLVRVKIWMGSRSATPSGPLGASHSQRATYFPEGHILASVSSMTLRDAIRIAMVTYLKKHGFDWREAKSGKWAARIGAGLWRKNLERLSSLYITKGKRIVRGTPLIKE
jgi:hypothetical protein